MSRPPLRLIAPLAMVLAAGLCALAALLAVGLLESRTAGAVRAALAEAGMGWAEAAPDGMLVRLSGTAPDEAARFRALSAAGTVIDAAHVVDEIAVEPPNP
ncbi:MAG: BON domain-containing protein, partial [Rhodovulum sp.]